MIKKGASVKSIQSSVNQSCPLYLCCCRNHSKLRTLESKIKQISKMGIVDIRYAKDIVKL